MERDRRDRLASGSRLESDHWGDSWRGLARDEGGPGFFARVGEEISSWFGGGRDEREEAWRDPGEERRADRQTRRVYNRMLSRDVRRDPWSGPPVQDVDPLPSGYYPQLREPTSRFDRRAGERRYPDHADEETGGMAGVVNFAPEGERAGYGPYSPRQTAQERHGIDEGYGAATEAYGFEAPTERIDANRFTYAGRGPRGYARSDERILEDVFERLTEHDEIDPSDVNVRVEGGEVYLDGTVEDRRTKRLAEEVAESVRGAREVHNNLRVWRSTESDRPRNQA